MLEAEAPNDVPDSWEPLLDALGYELTAFEDGYIAAAGGEAIAVVRTEQTAEALDPPISDLDDLPHRRLGQLMHEHRLDNGLLVAGPVVRLFAVERPPKRLPDRH